MQLKIYALALQAQKDTPDGVKIELWAAVVSAYSEDEALGKGLRIAQEECPAIQGWSNYNVATCEVSSHLLIRFSEKS